MNLKQKIAGVTVDNPLILASGILGITASSWKNVAANGAGGVTTKSLWLISPKATEPSLTV